MANFDLMAAYERRDRSILQSTSALDVAAALVGICDHTEEIWDALGTRPARPGELDFEKAKPFGSFLASCGHEDTDNVVLDWLAARPSVCRFQIAFWLISGIWIDSSRKHAVDADRAARAVALRQLVAAQQTHRDARIEQSFWDVMVRILDSPRTVPEVVDIAVAAVEELLSSQLGNVYFEKNLSMFAPRFIDKALTRIGRPPRRSQEFVAYVQDEGGQRLYVVEWCKGRSEVARVTSLAVKRRALRVEYEHVDDEFIDYSVAKLIFQTILVEFLRDEYRAKADRIQWVDVKTGEAIESQGYTSPA